MTSFGRRLAGFAGLPMISLVTPLLVLPVLGRVAGERGWASLAAGESIGTLAAIVIAYGWNTSGPPRVALESDNAERVVLYRESLWVRCALAAVCTPVVVLLCLAVASPGYGAATVLMGLAGSVTGLSFAWFAVGSGTPGAIAVYEAVPRVVAAACAALLVVLTRELVVYPVLAITASVGGIALYSRRTLRGAVRPAWGRQHLWRLLRRDRAVAFNDVAGGAYQSVPVPVVSLTSPAPAAAGYASADKLLKFGQYVPITLANAFQSWTVEGPSTERGRRLGIAVGTHVGVGLLGWAVLTLLGPSVSGVLFGPDVAAPRSTCFWLGAAFLLVSTRISLTRHVLVPRGRIRVVVASTVCGALVGVASVVGLSLLHGPDGAAAGLAMGEVTATALLVRPAFRTAREWASTREAAPITEEL
ncbi:hypothetical protein [Cellulomonas hominis]|uniref:hypothetical protein n=1 Tax=Cellulomonas hominis TaxID=156981 RepID=UPI001443D616|nr:hypothetical protein [Cellulomonas hominis]NKY10644.1 hypothetical protein [Cellulomonas hominis]